MSIRFLAAALFVFLLSAGQVSASAEYDVDPTYDGQFDVPHESVLADPLLFIDASDDDEVHILNYTDQTFFEFEFDDDDGEELEIEQEDTWSDDLSDLTFTSPRNLYVDRHENIYVLESGVVNLLHRIDEDYEAEGHDPEGDIDDDEEDEEEVDEDDDDDIAEYKTWEVIGGIDVAASRYYAYVVSTDTLTQVNIDTDAVETIAITSGRAVSVGRLGNVYVLSHDGNKITKFNNNLEELKIYKLSSSANDLEVDRRGNIYLARADGYLKQYTNDLTFRQAWQLPDAAVPTQITVSFDGDVFVAAENSATVYHYDFPDFPEPKKKDKAIYRFWSKLFKGHFFTSSYEEAKMISEGNGDWEYEKVSYKFIPDTDIAAGPVYRFWSEEYKHHFYTSSEDEKNMIIAEDDNWTYEGIAYNVYATEQTGSFPIYRFYSSAYRGHFYTADEGEKDFITTNDDNWAYEGVAWWVVEVE